MCEIDRFFEKVRVDPITKCWIWQASLDSKGYGRFWYDGRLYKAHRWAYDTFCKRLESLEIFVRHTCNNKICCNPKHLIHGTQSDNEIDKIKDNITKCAKLSKKDVLEIFVSEEKPDNLALCYEVSTRTIYNIKAKKTWNWLTDNL